MVSVKFPTPTGTPQLFLTRKRAYILDAAVQDKVVLTATRPKPSWWRIWPLREHTQNDQTPVTTWSLTINIDGKVLVRHWKDFAVAAMWTFDMPKLDATSVHALIAGEAYPVHISTDKEALINSIVYILLIAAAVYGGATVTYVMTMRATRLSSVYVPLTIENVFQRKD